MDCNEQYEKLCKDEFAELHSKLDKLDAAIRGNGKPGIQLRLDRLEQDRLVRNKIIWFVIGAIGSAITTVAATLALGG